MCVFVVKYHINVVLHTVLLSFAHLLKLPLKIFLFLRLQRSYIVNFSSFLFFGFYHLIYNNFSFRTNVWAQMNLQTLLIHSNRNALGGGRL